MALLRVMTVCLLVYAALEYRIRQALKDHDATFPNQTATGAEPNGAVGLPVFCGDSCPPDPWGGALGAQSRRGASALAPTAWKPVYGVLWNQIFVKFRSSVRNVGCRARLRQFPKYVDGDYECAVPTSHDPV